jgi:hypothetical protein
MAQPIDGVSRALQGRYMIERGLEGGGMAVIDIGEARCPALAALSGGNDPTAHG